MKNSGFTLIEFVLVLLLLLILSVVAVPKFTFVQSARINAAARTIASDIRYAQSLAISTGKKHGVVFEATPNQYYIYKETSSNIIKKPVSSDKFVIKLSDDFPNAVIDSDYKDIFDYLGAPATGGTFSISNNGSSPSKKISVLANTGMVQIN